MPVRSLAFRKAMLVLSCMAIFAAIPGVSMLQGLLAVPIGDDLGWSLPAFMASISISAVAMIFAQEPVRLLCEKAPIGGFLVGVLALTALFRGIRFFVDSLVGWYITAALSGFCCGLVVYVPMPPLSARWFPRHVGTVTGIIALGSSLGTALLSPVVQACIDGEGWRAACALMGAMTLAPAPLVALFVRGGNAPSGTGEEAGAAVSPEALPADGVASDGYAVQERGLRGSNVGWPVSISTAPGKRGMPSPMPLSVLFAVVLLVSLAGNMAAQVPAVTVSLGFGSTVAALGLTVLAMASAGGEVLFGVISDRYGAARCAAVSFVVAAMGFMLLWLAPSWAGVLYGAWGAIGLGCASLSLLPGLLARQLFPQRVAAVTARLSTAAALANALSPVALSLGPAFAGSYAPVLAALAFLFAASALVFARGARPCIFGEAR